MSLPSALTFLRYFENYSQAQPKPREKHKLIDPAFTEISRVNSTTFRNPLTILNKMYVIYREINVL